MNLILIYLALPLLSIVCQAIVASRYVDIARMIAVISACLSFVVAVYGHWFVLPEVQSLAPVIELGQHYQIFLKYDFVSSLMLVLTTGLVAVVQVLAPSLMGFEGHRKYCYLLITLMQFGLSATYLVNDIINFYIAWEIVLIPAFLLIGKWGNQSRVSASINFFLYTLAGSLLMLVGMAILYLDFGGSDHHAKTSFDFLYQNRLAFNGIDSKQGIAGICFFIAFFVKAPLVPFHGWLKNTYLQAPSLISGLIAGVMGKMGIYGLIRFMPMFPELTHFIAPLIIIVSAVAIVYGGFVAIQSTNLKEVVAYASLSHVSYILFGLFSLNSLGISGAILQMFNHGLLVTGLFVVVAYFEKEDLLERTGLAKATPVLTTGYFLLMLGSIGLPFTNGFAGEFMIILGGFQSFPFGAFLALFGTVIGAVYLLKWFAKNMLGAVQKDQEIKDVSGFLKFFLLSVSIIIVLLGVYPNFMFAQNEKFVSESMTSLFMK